MQYRYRKTVYSIAVVQTYLSDSTKISDVKVTVDGVVQTSKAITLVDDHRAHVVEVKIQAGP